MDLLSVTCRINTNTSITPQTHSKAAHRVNLIIHSLTAQPPQKILHYEKKNKAHGMKSKSFNSPLSQLQPECRLDSSQTISASDSTTHCVSERHLISMTTRKDMIPSQCKLNTNSASFALGGTAHTDDNTSSCTRSGARQYQQVRRAKLDKPDTDEDI